MKILVFSDTHGNPAFMENALAGHLAHGPVDMILHLGDGWRDFAELCRKYPDIPAHAVQGNCDAWSGACTLPTQRIVEAGGIRFFLTHGHQYHVKTDTLAAASAAAREKAQVLLYGHTHLQEDRREDTCCGSVRCINPGSAGSGYRPTYGVLETVGDQLLCGFGTK